MNSKAGRVLSIYERLMCGKVIVKRVEADRFGVNDRTIQRDLDDIRAHFAEEDRGQFELIYDRGLGGYIVRRLG